MNLADRAKTLTALVTRIRQACPVGGPAAQDTKELVDLFNAIGLPKLMCGVDDQQRLHVTIMGAIATTEAGPRAVMMNADFIWRFDPVHRVYTVLKDRTGEFQAFRQPSNQG